MRPVIAATLVFLVLLAVILLAISAGKNIAQSRPDSIIPVGEPVTLAYSPFESTALLWIADNQHFFAQNGLNVTLKKYNSGAASLDGLVNGDADIAIGVTEFPLVIKASGDAPVRALGNIDKGNFIYLVGRKDRIDNVSDLKGKRIGTTRGTVAEFHLGRFLTLHGMTLKDIVLVDVKTPSGWVNDTADGKIDAMVTAQPYANAARDCLGSNGFIWPVQSSQPVYALIISTDDWIRLHPDAAARVLRSFTEAEEYLHAHPAESRAIVQDRLNLDAGYMNTVWEQNRFSLTLDQSLVLAMEDEARWMIANNLTTLAAVPDFRRYIYPETLESVRPGSVHIIR